MNTDMERHGCDRVNEQDHCNQRFNDNTDSDNTRNESSEHTLENISNVDEHSNITEERDNNDDPESDNVPDPEAGQRGASDPPDGGWGWIIVLASALAFFLGGGVSRSFTLIYQQLLEIFQDSAAATSVTASIFGAVKMCSSPLVSLLCAKFSKRTVAVVGGVLTGVAMLMMSFPVSLPYIYLTYGVLVAFGFNLVLTPCFVIIGEYFKKRRARAMSLAMLGGSLGGMAIPPLLNYLFTTYNYTGTIQVLSALLLNLCVAGSLFRDLKQKKRRRRKISVREHDFTSFDDDQDLSRNTKDVPVKIMLSDSSQSDIQETGSQENRDLPERIVPSIVIEEHANVNDNTEDDETDELSKSTIVSQEEDFEWDDVLTLPAVTKPMSRQVSFQIDGDVFPLDSTPKINKKSKLRRTTLYKCHSLLASIGIHLFKEPRFTFYSLLMMGSVLSLSISGVFLSALVEDLGLDRKHTSLLLSASAAMDIPSKFASGFIFDLKKARPYRSLLLAALGFLTGICSLTMGFSVGFVDLFIVYMLYTFFASAYHTQHATVLADIVGTPNLSGAMGLCRLSQGVGFIMGPTIGGLIRDTTGRYQHAYIFSGSVLLTFTLLYSGVDVWLLWKQKQFSKEPLDLELPEFPEGHVARYRHDSISTVSM